MASQIIAAGNASAMYNHHIPIIPYERNIRSSTIFIVFEVLSQSTEAGWVSRSTNTQRRMQLSFSLSHFHPPRLLLHCCSAGSFEAKAQGRAVNGLCFRVPHISTTYRGFHPPSHQLAAHSQETYHRHSSAVVRRVIIT